MKSQLIGSIANAPLPKARYTGSMEKNSPLDLCLLCGRVGQTLKTDGEFDLRRGIGVCNLFALACL